MRTRQRKLMLMMACGSIALVRRSRPPCRQTSTHTASAGGTAAARQQLRLALVAVLCFLPQPTPKTANLTLDTGHDSVTSRPWEKCREKTSRSIPLQAAGGPDNATYDAWHVARERLIRAAVAL